MEGKKYHQQGIKSLDEHPAAFHLLMKLSVEGDQLYVLRQTGKEQELESQAHSRELKEALAELLSSYDAIFQEPTGLPPKGALDHQIVLKPGTQPTSVRPYKYPYFQKNEIERQVSELMDRGWIQHSHSPFSFPVILVKKKYGT